MPYFEPEGRTGEAEHAQAIPLRIEEEQQQVHNGSEEQVASPGPEVDRPPAVEVRSAS
jgi:hypothetical protein